MYEWTEMDDLRPSIGSPLLGLLISGTEIQLRQVPDLMVGPNDPYGCHQLYICFPHLQRVLDVNRYKEDPRSLQVSIATRDIKGDFIDYFDLREATSKDLNVLREVLDFRKYVQYSKGLEAVYRSNILNGFNEIERVVGR